MKSSGTTEVAACLPRRWRGDTLFLYSNSKNWMFTVDPVRTDYSDSVLGSPPSRYDKSYRGERVYSGYRPNPLGKHPDDVWPIQPIMPSDMAEHLATRPGNRNRC